MNKKFLLALCTSLLMAGALNAQDIVIDAEFRPRFEARNGYQSPLTNDQMASFPTFQRTRLGVGFQNGNLKTRIPLQDARVWGQSNIDAPNTGKIGLYEAWAELSFCEHSSITVGRQPIKYDQNRLFSVSSWTTQGKTHDLALYKYNNKDITFKVDLGLAYNNPSNIKNEEIIYDVDKLYKSLAFLRLEKGLAKGLSLSAIIIDEAFQDVKTDDSNNEYIDGKYRRYTSGANLVLSDKEKALGFILTGYYQFGKSKKTYTDSDGNVSRKENGAFFGTARLNYRVLDWLNAYIAYDIYSGTDYQMLNGDKNTTWSKLYGSNHSFNGSMEYWRDIKDYGLQDIYGGLTASVCENVSIDASYHYFMTQQATLNNEAQVMEAGSKLGSELDLSLSWKIMKYAKLDCGWSTYFTNHNTFAIKNVTEADARFAQWAFVSLTINPELFNSKNFQRK